MYFFGFLYVLLTIACTALASFVEFELFFHILSWFWLAWITYFVIHDRRGERPTLIKSLYKSIELLFKGWWLLFFLITMQLIVNYIYFVLPHTTPNLVLYIGGYSLIILVPFFVLPLLMDDVTRCLPVLRYCWFKIKHGLRALIVFFIGLLPLSFMLFALVAAALLAISTLASVICTMWIPQLYCISAPSYISNFIVYQVSRSIILIFVAVAQSIFYQTMLYGRD
jgi:hypothetical protein